MDPHRKVSPGQPVRWPAVFYNELVDLVGRSPKSAGGARGPDAAAPNGVVWIQNDTGAPLARLEVVGLGAPVILPGDHEDAFTARTLLSGTAPADSDAGKFAILQEPIAAGAIGRAMVVGVTAVKLHVADEDDEYADVLDSDPTCLKTGTGGAAQILWKESGTTPPDDELEEGEDGLLWAVVRLGNVADRVGALFRVNLAQTGGSDGDKTTSASWTYSVTTLGGTSLLTGASPEKSRPFGTRSAATAGYAYYGEDGSAVLAEAWESEGRGGCS